MPTRNETTSAVKGYLDHCATSPLDAGVRRAMEEVLDGIESRELANPSSTHTPGRRARALLNEARRRIAGRLGARESEIIFTASGSEANNLAIKGLAMRGPRPFHLLVSAIEHDSVRHAARALANQFDWVRMEEIGVDEYGIVDLSALESACERGASLVSVMSVNNELGTRQPVEDIAAIAHRCGALFHTDAVQAAGRLPIDVAAMGCDLLSLSAHKISGPRGAGLLFARSGIRFEPLIHGGHQEAGRRAGTEDLPAAIGFAEAMERAIEDLGAENSRLAQMEKNFLAQLDGVDFIINGSNELKVPGVVNLSVRGIASHDLVMGMDLEGFAISAGAACSSGVIEPSHVLQAMGIEEWRVLGGVRISFGKTNTPAQAAAAGCALSGLCARLRAGLDMIEDIS